MNKVSCQIDLEGRLPDKPLTVGDKFLLMCDGEMSASLQESAQIQFQEKADEYTLHVLKVKEASPQSFKLIVTSYKPGEYKSKILTVSDGTTAVTTSELSWQVSSVLEPGKKPEMVASQGPFLISYPIELWILLVLTLVIIGSFLGLIILRKNKRKKLRAHLDTYSTALSPLSEFSKEMRKIRRLIDNQKADDPSGDAVKQIEEMFRLYLIRELKVPALQLSDRALLKEISREHSRLFAALNVDIRRILSEFAKANRDLQHVKIKDCQDLCFLARKIAEQIHEMKRKTKES